jgi:hypothetical protein
VKIILTSSWVRPLAVALAAAFLSLGLITGTEVTAQDSTSGQTQAAPQAQAAANTAIQKINAACKVSDTETDPKKINKQLDCVMAALGAQRRKIVTEQSLQSMIDQAYGVSQPPAAVQRIVQAAPPLPAPQGNVTQSASNTTSACGAGSGDSNPLIRVHRVLMAPKNASDDFGHRLGRRYIVYQVTISNDNKDYQYLIHDVSVDLSSLFGALPGTYQYAASSQDLTLLRGIPEKGQDLDPRNLTLHILQGIGSVAGAVAGLTPFSDVMGSSVAVFNGPFLQSFVGIAPDHTGTQLNRLSDSAYITNTIVDKQRARTIALFIPEATLLSLADQRQYWKNPYAFLQQLNLDQADVCVDGAFITTVPGPTLTAAVLTPGPAGTPVGQGVQAVLTVQGTNITLGDTQVVGLGSTPTMPIPLTGANGTAGSVTLTLPTNYTAGMPVHLASAANPSAISATVATTVGIPAPTLTAAVLAPNPPATSLGQNVSATLGVTGTNLTAGDTQVVGLGTTIPLSAVNATGTAGSANITLPANYAAGMQVHLASAANPNAVSRAIASTEPPTLATAVLAPNPPATSLGQNVSTTFAVTGTNLIAGDTQVVGLGTTVPLSTVNATGTAGSANITLPANYAAGMPAHLASAANPSAISATKSFTSGPVPH